MSLDEDDVEPIGHGRSNALASPEVIEKDSRVEVRLVASSFFAREPSYLSSQRRRSSEFDGNMSFDIVGSGSSGEEKNDGLVFVNGG